MENFDALDLIAQTRGEVEMDEVPTGENLFLVWGWPTALFFLLEFVLWFCFRLEWSLWLWTGIPLVAIPFMVYYLRKDHARTHTRTRGAKIILDYWIFTGVACFAGALILSLAHLGEECLLPLIGLLVGTGSFVSGEVLRFRPKTVGGLLGCVIGGGSVLFQEALWHWQLLAMALVAVIALIIPGSLFKKFVRNGA